jgi:hypothetical protein
MPTPHGISCLIELPGFVRLVLLEDQFAPGPPPFGETAEFSTLHPDAVGAAAASSSTAAACEIQMVHAVAAHRAFSIDHRVVESVVLADLVHLDRIKPDNRMGLGVKKRFQFPGIEKHAVARGAALDAESRVGFKLDHG